MINAGWPVWRLGLVQRTGKEIFPRFELGISDGSFGRGVFCKERAKKILALFSLGRR